MSVRRSLVDILSLNYFTYVTTLVTSYRRKGIFLLKTSFLPDLKVCIGLNWILYIYLYITLSSFFI